MSNQRHFQRVLFEHEATITIDGITYETEIIDLSLNGALINKPNNWSINEEDSELRGELRFSLAENLPDIVMQISLAHQTMLYLGLKCELIDVDAVSMLRRIIELNSHDPELLQRDLTALAH